MAFTHLTTDRATLGDDITTALARLRYIRRTTRRSPTGRNLTLLALAEQRVDELLDSWPRP